MNAIDVLKTATRERPARVERENIRNEPKADESTGEKRAERARFAQVLALLAATGDKTRLDIMKQMPSGDASLLDKLLAAAGSETDNADALRYGMIVESRPGSDSKEGTSAQLHGLHGLARASRNGNIETIARIAARRGASVEELLAVGDSKAADLKSALDALLSNAGTPEGLALAGGNGIDAVAAAHAAALGAARGKSAVDVETPVRDIEALAPEFRTRVERVLERMKSEFGHDVEIVETARSQERQDHLYDQGRTRPGAVVTWTRDSAHLTGHATDVVIDGKWNNPEGYARLQRIAREEGLRTIGMRDPGHLEMPVDERITAPSSIVAQASAAAKASHALERSQSARSVGRVATPVATEQSGVAKVAGVASVASVARVATSGATVSGVAIPQTAHTTQSNQNESGKSDNSRDERGRSGYEQAQAFTTTSSTVSTESSSVAAKPAAAGVESFNRVLDAERVRDSAPARAVSQLTLQVEAPNGGTDEIRIGMRGNAVNTQITTDAQNADRLRVRTGELQDALGKHGLETESVRITGTAKQEGIDASKGIASAADRDAVKVGVAQQSQQGDGFSQHNQRDRAANARDWQERQDARRERDEQRQSEERQRRNPFNPESK